MIDETGRIIAADKKYVWHPFTQMLDWIAPNHEPLVLVAGEGPWLEDSYGRRYLDGNSSIWTNIHGHNHPRTNQAIRDQLERVAHTSFLGFTNPLAAKLAERLVALVPQSRLTKVFFSDNGSTAIEVAIKMSVQYFQQNGKNEKVGFVAFENAYHGDTLGASSLGGISVFHDRFRGHQFPVTRVSDPGQLEAVDGRKIAGVVIEPLIQGAAGMQVWPRAMLGELRAWCDRNDVLLTFDEVMTGFGRTGKMFAFEHEAAKPDFLVLAKGLSGGYLPLGATLTTDRVYEGFLGRHDELRTFFYGHSYAGNALGCAAALTNLQLFESERTLEKLGPKIERFSRRLAEFEQVPNVRAVRQIGFIGGIELGKQDRTPFDWREQVGAKVCLRARQYRLLTRPILDVIVLMLPLCATADDIDLAAEGIKRAIAEVCSDSLWTS
jgi:adenosylmethionine---8-amino-7-oxononanoate aminotransferase